MEAFLGMNDYELNISNPDLENLVIDVANNKTNKSTLTEIIEKYLIKVSV